MSTGKQHNSNNSRFSASVALLRLPLSVNSLKNSIVIRMFGIMRLY